MEIIRNIFQNNLYIVLLITIISFNCTENPIEQSIEPFVRIVSPQDGSKYNKLDTIPFISYLLSDDDTLKFDSLKWESDILGFIGKYSHTYSMLSPGNHKIKCTIYLKNKIYSDQVNVTVSNIFAIDTIFYDDTFEIYKIPGAKIFALNVDNEDNPLIGTDNLGLFYRNKGIWENYNKTDGLFDNSIQTIGIDQNNIIYIGYYWYTGISKKQLNGWQFIPMDESLGGDVHVIKFDDHNVLWAAIHDGNVAKYNNGIWQTFADIPLDYHHPNELLFDKEKVVWSSSDYGCINYDGQTWKSLRVNGDLIRALCLTIDQENNIWFGCYDGLYRINKTDTTIYTTKNSILPSNKIWALTVDMDDIIYIGTDYGLFKYYKQNWDEISLPIEDNRIFKLKADSKNHIWFVIGDLFGCLKK